MATGDATIENNDANTNISANTHKKNKSSSAMTNVPDSRSGQLLSESETRNNAIFNQDNALEMISMGVKRKAVEDGGEVC